MLRRYKQPLEGMLTSYVISQWVTTRQGANLFFTLKIMQEDLGYGFLLCVKKKKATISVSYFF